MCISVSIPFQSYLPRYARKQCNSVHLFHKKYNKYVHICVLSLNRCLVNYTTMPWIKEQLHFDLFEFAITTTSLISGLTFTAVSVNWWCYHSILQTISRKALARSMFSDLGFQYFGLTLIIALACGGKEITNYSYIKKMMYKSFAQSG